MTYNVFGGTLNLAQPWQWHQLDHVQIVCTTLQTYNHTCRTPSLIFNRLDALHDAQTTVSKH